MIDFLRESFRRFDQAEAVVGQDGPVTYQELLSAVDVWRDRLSEQAGCGGGVVSLEADFSPQAIAALLALMELRTVIVPLSEAAEAQKQEFRAIAEVEHVLHIQPDGEWNHSRTGTEARHELIGSVKDAGHPGLVLFSSGSTGKSKGSVHDLVPLLEKFKTPRHAFRTIPFLLFDHIGGWNTMLYTLSNGGCLIVPSARDPETVCRTIAQQRVELLPTSPTFLNLLLITESYQRHDLSSLKLVTYGTEPMPESTLKRLHALLPHVRLQQTYGLTEVGILRSKSQSSESLWVKLGGEDFETRVVDGILHIKARSAMLGYLNAPSPFSSDGWLVTGDAVEVDGEYVRILGRTTEVINVGGEKVYPAEVESVLQQMPGVAEAIVHGEQNPITGQLVAATVRLSIDESPDQFRLRMRQFCSQHLPRFKVPQKVRIVTHGLHGERFKKLRTAQHVA